MLSAEWRVVWYIYRAKPFFNPRMLQGDSWPPFSTGDSLIISTLQSDGDAPAPSLTGYQLTLFHIPSAGILPLLIVLIQLKMEGSAQEYEEIESVKWSSRDTDIYIDLMVEQVKKGNRPTYTFTEKALREIQTKFCEKTGHNYILLQFRNKFQMLRKEYQDFRKLLKRTVFGWNSITKMVKADDEVWTTYIQENPSAAKFKKRGCPRYPELHLIFDGTIANGELAFGNAEDPPDSSEDDDVAANLGIQNDGLTLCRVDRTPTTLRRGKRKNSDFAEACKAFAECCRAQLAWLNARSSPAVAETDPYSIAKCMKVLTGLEGVGPDEFVNATKLLQEAGGRETFMSISDEMKLLLIQRLP